MPLLIIILLLSIPATACLSPLNEPEKNLKSCLDEAYQGSEFAQFTLGLIYYNGDIAQKDIVNSIKWFTKAAEQGLVYAQYNLAVIFASGEGGLPRNEKKGLEWLIKAAEQDYENAQFTLAQRYDFGEGVEQSPSTAAKWYLKAAEQGHSGAQNNIGVMYYGGVGVLKNISRAHMFFYMAAAKGEQLSIKNLALIKAEMNTNQIKLAKQFATEWMENYP